MEPRRHRPKFFNPFTERVKGTSLSLFRGFFRAMPLHRWSGSHIQKVLGFVAVRPTLFGFPDQPTCVVNTLYFLPSSRSRLRGAWVFGTERGCKSIVVPSSCTGDHFDELDAKLIEPLFRLNPGVEYLYLSRSCQGMTSHLTLPLSRCLKLREVTLEGWNDAAAIHRVMMACRNADVLDTFSLTDHLQRDWRNELSVQALSTLVEMHPRLRAVKSHRLYLADWQAATQFSRCRHNVALIVFVCDYALLLQLSMVLLLCLPGYAVFRVLRKLCREVGCEEHYVNFWSALGFVSTVLCGVLVDFLISPRYGSAWVHLYKFPILLHRRIYLWRNKHSSALVIRS